MRTLPSSLPSKYCHAPKTAPAVAHAASFCLLGIVLKTLFMFGYVRVSCAGVGWLWINLLKTWSVKGGECLGTLASTTWHNLLNYNDKTAVRKYATHHATHRPFLGISKMRGDI